MLNLYELAQFAAFADCGTLSQASEKLLISQPTLTRSMRHVEDAFGAALFLRSKNRIELNETGILAAEYAKKLLFEADKAVQAVQAFDKSLRTITVASCAPAPLWVLLPELSQKFPERTISSQLSTAEEIRSAVIKGTCDIGILSAPCTAQDGIKDIPYIKEHLFVCVSEGHALWDRQSVTLHDLNGFNCLLRDQIGFWTELCKQKMPASRFLIQTDEFEFQELVRTSTLLCFITDAVSHPDRYYAGRRCIPVTDPEANVQYHIICSAKNKALILK